jgi:hypothetical protein
MATALVIEVYALHCFFVGTILFTFINAMHRTEFDQPISRSNTRVWYLFALLLGLSFTNHLSTILLAPSLLFFFFVEHNNFTNASKRVALLVPLFLAGLLPYLYLPIRSSFDPILDWGNPSSFDSFYRHISGQHYRTWMFSSMEVSIKNFGHYFLNLPSSFGYVSLLLSPVGLIYLLKYNWKLGVLNILLFGGCLLYSINYDIMDIEAYFLLADIAVGIWITFGLLLISRVLTKHRLKIVLTLSIICLSTAGITSFKKVSQNGNYLVEDYVMNMFDSLEKNAIIITYQWDFLTAPFYYYQLVKGMRPDIVFIDKELLQRPWYYNQLNLRYPEIMAKIKPQTDIFMIELDKFVRGLDNRTPEVRRKYHSVIQAIVETNINTRPVYFTSEMFTGRDKNVASPYRIVPEGLAFRLYKKEPAELRPAFSDLRFRNFNRSGYYYDTIKEHQSVMLRNRANFLFVRHNRIDEALQIVDRALIISPDNRGIQECKERIMKAKISIDG